jgi:tripartite-type tricarboxylate transporter receptor subunit TctC
LSERSAASVQARLKELGYVSVADDRRSPEGLQAYLASEVQYWADVIKGAGIAPE